MGVPIDYQLQAYWSDSKFNDLRMDASTHTLQTITYEHHEIHAGSFFHCHYENACTNTNEQSVIAFNTPNSDKEIHILATGSVTSIARLSIVENPSIDNDEGTTLTIYNRNRRSTKTSGVSTIQASPVSGSATSFNEAQAANANITTTTTLDSVVVGAAGAQPFSGGIGGLFRGGAEWVLEPNQQYAFIAESLSDDDNYHTIELNWYEHTPKD